MLTAGPHPNYDHIHEVSVDRLPRARRTDSRVTTRGYAVGMGGKLPQIWVFFADLEPAYAFGRAGRMSTVDVTGFGVYEAVDEFRWDEDEFRDIRTLHLALDSPADKQIDDQRALLTRWVQGVSPRSAYFLPHGE